MSLMSKRNADRAGAEEIELRGVSRTNPSGHQLCWILLQQRG
jgi:hypothetical protein